MIYIIIDNEFAKFRLRGLNNEICKPTKMYNADVLGKFEAIKIGEK